MTKTVDYKHEHFKCAENKLENEYTDYYFSIYFHFIRIYFIGLTH